jgi:acetyl coenzyme A synthetase (ADP forming)-like protein
MIVREDPEHLEEDVVLRDGRTVHVRPAQPTDRALIEDYLLGLSDETRRLRFWSTAIDVTEIASNAVRGGYPEHLTLLALTEGAHVVGGAQFVKQNATRAELSVSVSDELQGAGLGTILVGKLVDAAFQAGFERLEANVLPENHPMIEVFRECGYPFSIRAKPGAVSVEILTAPTVEAESRFEEREAQASANAVRSILEPRSVAVIGASRDARSIGGRLLRNLVTYSFRGTVYPVNPSASSVQGLRAYPSIEEVPGPVDVAFVAVRSDLVPEIAEACGHKGVRGLVVISAGFAETAGEGSGRQEALLAICRRWGMRLIGPNCMGIVNTDDQVALNGTFASIAPHPGRIGFLSQSGAVGIAVMTEAERRGMGLSSFVSVGNKADISGNDLLCYWDQDPRTSVALLYLESFGNPRRFSQLARRVGTRKPIVAVKSGRTRAGQQAAGSHTGSLVATSDLTVEALFRECGVIRTDTLAEMFDVSMLLADQPLPEGDRVGIVTNGGGLGILCADTCEANGLTVPQLSAGTVEELRGFLAAEASLANPVDMIASATGADYERAIATIARDPNVDLLIVIYIPPVEEDAEDVAEGIVKAVEMIDGTVPVLTTFMAGGVRPELIFDGRSRIPTFRFPEQAAIAAARVVEYAGWRTRPAGEVPSFDDCRPDEAAAIIAAALSRGAGWLDPWEVEGVLSCYGIPTARTRTAETPQEAGRVAAEHDGPVALKVRGPLHKSDVGGVALGLDDPEEVVRTAEEIRQRVLERGEPFEGFLVQEMVQGVEMLVGVTHDDVFGPIVVCGSGGTSTELLKDIALRIAPITDVTAAEMLRSLATYPLLDGYRGAPAADVSALEEIVLRVSRMASERTAILEMDCNPVIVGERGAAVVDARIRVG